MNAESLIVSEIVQGERYVIIVNKADIRWINVPCLKTYHCVIIVNRAGIRWISVPCLKKYHCVTSVKNQVTRLESVQPDIIKMASHLVIGYK